MPVERQPPHDPQTALTCASQSAVRPPTAHATVGSVVRQHMPDRFAVVAPTELEPSAGRWMSTSLNRTSDMPCRSRLACLHGLADVEPNSVQPAVGFSCRGASCGATAHSVWQRAQQYIVAPRHTASVPIATTLSLRRQNRQARW
jgi:hypothetical protein